MLDLFHFLVEAAMWGALAWVCAYVCMFFYALVVGPSNEPNPPADWKDDFSQIEDWDWDRSQNLDNKCPLSETEK